MSSAAPRPTATPGAAGQGRLAQRDADQLAGGGAARAQQRGVAAAAVGAGRGDRGGDQAGEIAPGNAEEEEEELGVERVLARLVERRAEVVAHEARAGELGLEVARLARDLREGGARAAGKVVGQRHVDLRVYEVRALVRDGALDRAEGVRREQDDVVGRRLRLGAHRRADLLEERVGRGEVDDPVDSDLGGRKAGAPDAHRVARLGVQVGGRLLGEQDAGARARERAQLTGERLRVAGRQAEHLAGAGLLD